MEPIIESHLSHKQLQAGFPTNSASPHCAALKRRKSTPSMLHNLIFLNTSTLRKRSLVWMPATSFTLQLIMWSQACFFFFSVKKGLGYLASNSPRRSKTIWASTPEAATEFFKALGSAYLPQDSALIKYWKNRYKLTNVHPLQSAASIKQHAQGRTWHIPWDLLLGQNS